MGEIHQLGKPTVSEEHKESMIRMLKGLLELAEAGELRAGVVVVRRASTTQYKIVMAGHLNRLETMGMMYAALHETATAAATQEE